MFRTMDKRCTPPKGVSALTPNFASKTAAAIPTASRQRNPAMKTPMSLKSGFHDFMKLVRGLNVTTKRPKPSPTNTKPATND